MERPLAEAGWLDAEISDSFPASDPLSHWAGPRRSEGESDPAHGHAVTHVPVEDALEQQQLEAPARGTTAQ